MASTSSLPKTTKDASYLEKTSSDATLNGGQETPPFLLSVEAIESRFKTSARDGLSSNVVPDLQKRDGRNELSGGGGVNPW